MAIPIIVTDLMEQEHTDWRPYEYGHFQVVSDVHLVNMLSIHVKTHGREV